MQVLNKHLKWIKKRKELKLILSLFLITRTILLIVGVSANRYISPISDGWHGWRYSEYLWMDIWAVWDSGWYLKIAQNGYSLISDLPIGACCGQTIIGFFPLYPLLIRLVSNITGNYVLAGILVSNISLIIAAVYLYNLVLVKFNKKCAERAVILLMVFPTTFLFSAVLSESLFIALLIATFYYAEKKKWFISGILGYFLALTRPQGVLIIIPLLIIYFRQINNNLKNIKLNIIYTTFVPLGLLTYAIFNYFLTGDLLAYVDSKHQDWGHRLSNPILILFASMFSSTGFIIIFLPSLLILLIQYFGYQKRRIQFEYFILGILFLIAPLLNGFAAATSIPRHISIIFPIFIVLSQLNLDEFRYEFFYFLLFTTSIILMSYWSNGFYII